jgi:hypothetical protein
VRYAASALLARHYAGHGFHVVVSDIVVGTDVATWMDAVGGADRHLVVLTPSVEVIVARERTRGGDSYRAWREPGGSLADAVRALGAALAEAGLPLLTRAPPRGPGPAPALRRRGRGCRGRSRSAGSRLGGPAIGPAGRPAAGATSAGPGCEPRAGGAHGRA